jgi:hypothetical protein
VLQKDQDVQLLFLRDPGKRPISQPIPLPSPALSVDEVMPAPAQSEEQSLLNMLKQQMPPQLQAVDTLSQIFFATPLF